MRDMLALFHFIGLFQPRTRPRTSLPRLGRVACDAGRCCGGPCRLLASRPLPQGRNAIGQFVRRG